MPSPLTMEGSKMKIFDTKTFDWQDPPRGYYLTDVKEKVVWEDENTGAKMALIKFPVGIADKLHSHPESDQFAYGISGEVETGDGQKISMDGQFFYFSKGETHGATKITEEAVALFYWDGPSNPNVMD